MLHRRSGSIALLVALAVLALLMAVSIFVHRRAAPRERHAVRATAFKTVALTGTVTADGMPQLLLAVAGQLWPTIIDTGFNGELELPDHLRPAVNARFIGHIHVALGGGQHIEEEVYLVDFPFDGETLLAEATFVPGQEILLGKASQTPGTSRTRMARASRCTSPHSR